MEKIALTAQVRDKAGKGVARGLRRNNMVPAVLYSHGKSLPIAMGNKEVTKILKTEGGEHALINLKLDGAKDQADRMALIKDYQVDPINGSLIHVDLMEVAMNEKVKISVSCSHHRQRCRSEGRRHFSVWTADARQSNVCRTRSRMP